MSHHHQCDIFVVSLWRLASNLLHEFKLSKELVHDQWMKYLSVILGLEEEVVTKLNGNLDFY